MKNIYRSVLFGFFFSTLIFAQTRHDVFVPVGAGDSLDATYFVPSVAPPAAGFPVMLFVHGFGLDKTNDTASARIYAQSKFLTFCYSVRGHGKSSGQSTIMSRRERQDLSELVAYIKRIPNVDTNAVGILGGSQGGLHSLWAVKDSLVACASADVIIPKWASDMFANGAVRRSFGLLLHASTVRYNPIRDTLWKLLRTNAFDSLAAIFPLNRDIDTSILNQKEIPLLMFIKYQDYYFEASDGLNFFPDYPGLKKMYLGTGGHYSDESDDEWNYQFDILTRWFKYFLRNVNNGILDEPKYTYSFSSLPLDSLGHFKWYRVPTTQLPFNDVTMHRFYFHQAGKLNYSAPGSSGGSMLFVNAHKDSNYTFEMGYASSFKGTAFDAAFQKTALVFETSPLDTSVLMFGSPKMKLLINSTTSQMPFNIQIYEVDSSGNKFFINRINYVGRNIPSGMQSSVEASGYFHAHQFQKHNKIRIEITNIDKTNRALLGIYPFVFPIFKYGESSIAMNESYASYIELPFLTSEQVLYVGEPIAGNFSLSQNYPNPFNSTTALEYSLPQNAHVTLKVYDILGREVKTLFEGNQFAGTYKATFNADQLASGVYFYRLITAVNDNNVNNLSEYTRKMILIK